MFSGVKLSIRSFVLFMQVCSEYRTVLQDENAYIVEWTGRCTTS